MESNGMTFEQVAYFAETWGLVYLDRSTFRNGWGWEKW